MRADLPLAGRHLLQDERLDEVVHVDIPLGEAVSEGASRSSDRSVFRIDAAPVHPVRQPLEPHGPHAGARAGGNQPQVVDGGPLPHHRLGA